MTTAPRSTLLGIVCALAACTDPTPADDSATSTSPSETADEVGTSETATTGDTTGEIDTTGETDTTSETGEPEPVCGDGVVTGPELCDDGNAIDDDGCSNACAPRICPITWSRIDDQKTISGSGGNLDNSPLAELPSGDIVVANTVDGQSSIDVRVQVWTPDGELVWEVVHVLGPLRDGLGDLLADASGDIFVAAGANVGTDGIAQVLRLSGTDGSIVWTFEHDVVGELDRAQALALDDQNRVLVALQTGGKVGETNVEVRALDPMTGVSEWTGKWTSAGTFDDGPSAIGFDPSSGQVWVLANTQSDADVIDATLLSFVPPSEAPVLATVPIDDGHLDRDRGGSLVFDSQDRLWIAVQDAEVDTISVQLAQIDKVDGSVLELLDSRDMAIEGPYQDTWVQGQLDALDGGLVLAGWNYADLELGIEHYGYVVALDGEGQHDCVARFMDYTANFLFEPLGTSSGAIFVNGHIRESGDLKSALVRVR